MEGGAVVVSGGAVVAVSVVVGATCVVTALVVTARSGGSVRRVGTPAMATPKTTPTATTAR